MTAPRPTPRQLPGSWIAVAAVLLPLALVCPGCGPLDSAPLVVVEAETRPNTLDGCTACGCRTQGAIDPGGSRDWWFSFGLAR